MALSFVTDKMSVDMLKAPFEQMRQPLRPRFDSLLMEDSLSSEQMKVFLRVRPFTEKEKKEAEDQNCFSIESQHTIVTRAPSESFTFKNSVHGMGKVSHKYSFNSILGPQCCQKDVFNKVVRGPVKEFLEGRNALVFTYGITSSGKTYTIQGPSHSIGILPRALDIIFNTIGDRSPGDKSSNVLAPSNFDDVMKLDRGEFDTVMKHKEELLGFHQAAEQLDARSGQLSVGDNDGLSVASQESGESTSTSAHLSRLAQILAEANTREVDSTKLDLDLKEGMRFSIWVSYAEIYNECIYDLFVPLSASSKKNNAKSSTNCFGQAKTLRRPTLELRTDRRGSIYIRGLRCFPVTSADDAYRLLLIGRQNQQMASTRLNLTSSRSHTIFSVYAIRCSEKSHKSQLPFARVSMLNFCDLAGSERTMKTQNVGERLREAGNINTSLLTLGRCIQTLRNNQLNPDRPQLVPYRESKLTRLFQSFFTGKGKACMLVNISQCSSMFDETLHVLKFSAVAKQVLVEQHVQPTAPVHCRNNTEEEARRSRFRSLGLRTPKPGKRVSIAWENTPRSCASPSLALSNVLFTGDDGTLVEERIENTMASIAEETMMEYDTEELLAIIDDLKNQLIEKKQECVRIESKVREEVCREMDELVLRLENQHDEALREQEAFMQEQSDRRIQLYLNSVRKTKKRARLMESEELEPDEADNGLAEALILRNRVEELESELSDLRTQCADQREALTHVTRERDEQTLAVTRLQFKAGLTDIEIAQRKAKDEEKIRELEAQLQKMMSQAKDESRISDVECQNEQSHLVLVTKNVADEVDSQKSISAFKAFSPPAIVTQHTKKKVFSPVLPKRQSDEVAAQKSEERPSAASESTVKTNVFSPLLFSEQRGESCDESTSSQASNRHYEDSCVSFNVPPTPKTVIKKDSVSLAKENEKLVNQLNVMQKELMDALTARKIAETSVHDLRTELANVTAGMGSFLRHEAETEMEEALDQKRKEVDTLTKRLQETESTLRELEMRSVANHDALAEEQELRKGLSSRCEQLEMECRRHIDDIQRERRHREEIEAKEVEQRSVLTKRLHDAAVEIESKDKLYQEIHDCRSKLQIENQEILARLKAHEAEFCKEKEIYEMKMESSLAEAKRERHALKSQIEDLESTLAESKLSSDQGARKIDSLAAERLELRQKISEAKEKLEDGKVEIMKLRTTTRQLEKDLATLSAEKDQLEKRSHLVQEMELKLENERRCNKEMDASIIELRDQLSYLRAECKACKVKSERDENRIHSLQSEIQQLNSKLEAGDQLQAQLKALEKEDKSLAKALQKKDHELQVMANKLQATEADVQEFMEERSLLYAKCSELESRISELKKYMDFEEKENCQPGSERHRPSKLRGQTLSEGHSKSSANDDDSQDNTRACSSRRVTRSMKHK